MLRRKVAILIIILLSYVLILLTRFFGDYDTKALHRYMIGLIQTNSIYVKKCNSEHLLEFGSMNKSWLVSISQDNLISFMKNLEELPEARPTLGSEFWMKRANELFGINTLESKVYEKTLNHVYSERLHHLIVVVPPVTNQYVDIFINVESF